MINRLTAFFKIVTTSAVLLATAFRMLCGVPLPADLILTSVPNGLVSQKNFQIQQTIHGYLTLPEKAVGRHKLEAHWIAPTGAIQERCVVKFDGGKQGRQTAYIWFRLGDDSKTLMGGLPDDEKIRDVAGEWHVEVFWDDGFLLERRFEVIGSYS